MGTITKKDLINYLRETPENLNFNIFGGMLDDYKNTYETNPALVLWDWEGTKLAEYSREDALALTELPTPQHITTIRRSRP